MEATFSPLGDGVFSIHGCAPADFQAFHEGFEESKIDDVVFDDEDIDGWDGSIADRGGVG